MYKEPIRKCLQKTWAPSAFLAFVFLWLLSVIFVPCAVGLNCVRIASNLQLRCNRNICKDGEMLTLEVEQLERNKGGVYGSSIQLFQRVL